MKNICFTLEPARDGKASIETAGRVRGTDPKQRPAYINFFILFFGMLVVSSPALEIELKLFLNLLAED